MLKRDCLYRCSTVFLPQQSSRQSKSLHAVYDKKCQKHVTRKAAVAVASHEAGEDRAFSVREEGGGESPFSSSFWPKM